MQPYSKIIARPGQLLVEEHLVPVAELTSCFASKIGFENIGYIAGFLHDLGKANPEWGKDLLDNLEEQKKTGKAYKKKPLPHHSLSGASAALSMFGLCPLSAKKRGIDHCNLLLPSVISSHHSGMLDYVDMLKSDDSIEEEVRKSRLEMGEEQLNTFMFKEYFDFDKKIVFGHQMPNIDDEIRRFAELSKQKYGMMIYRFLLSCLVDSDRINAGNVEIDNTNKIQHCLDKIREYIDNLSSKAVRSKVNNIRKDIRRMCIAASKKDFKMYVASIPTGGGKTLALMELALEIAVKNNMERVFVAIPYCSIIEQNSRIYREVFGGENVLEHHSAAANLDDRLALERWDKPIIVTTNVQFLETLFSRYASRLRKLHNIYNSVVIFDEVQTLPSENLDVMGRSFDYLTNFMKCKLIFSSATQPNIAQRYSFDSHEVIDNPDDLYRKMSRVEYSFMGKVSYNKITKEAISRKENTLIVCNKTKMSYTIFNKVMMYKKLSGDPLEVYHLSARMTPDHRSDVISWIRRDMEEGKRVIVVSTQLIEAGVDLDFNFVYKMIEGLDNCVQAAGRCNRNGKLAKGHVFLYDLDDKNEEDFETTGVNRCFRTAYNCTNNSIKYMLRRFGRINIDIPVMDYYFQKYYDYSGSSDKKEILKDEDGFNFKTVAANFKMIDDENQNTVIVPLDSDGSVNADILELIEKEKEGTITLEERRRIYRYSITVRDTDSCLSSCTRILGKDGESSSDKDSKVYLLKNYSRYDKDFGIMPD